jgi:transitional endoplasmic reticulum ATPase
LTNGFSGAEIEGVCNRAAMNSMRRYVDKKEKDVKSIKVTQEDFEMAIQKMRPLAPKPLVTSAIK